MPFIIFVIKLKFTLKHLSHIALSNDINKNVISEGKSSSGFSRNNVLGNIQVKHCNKGLRDEKILSPPLTPIDFQ